MSTLLDALSKKDQMLSVEERLSAAQLELAPQ